MDFDLDALESRRLFAVSALVVGSTLLISGDDQPNGIGVNYLAANNQIVVTEYQTGPGYVAIGTFAAAALKEIKVYGHGAADTINVSDAVKINCFVYGGAGPDYLKGGGKSNVVYGNDTADWNTKDNDQLVGSTGSSLLYGQAGKDTFTAAGGTDYMYGGDDADKFIGADTGNSAMNGENGIDVFYPGKGVTLMNGGKDGDAIDYSSWSVAVNVTIDSQAHSGPAGGAWVHTIMSGTVEQVRGTSKNDYFYGSAFAETFMGGAGDDYFKTGDGDDVVFAEDGNDLIYTEWGNDVIHGWDGKDTIDSGWGDDFVHGGEGNDRITTDVGNDVVWADGGDDFVQSGDGDDSVRGGFGDDFLDGGWGNDSLYGEGDDDTLLGDPDAIFQQYGADLLVGGAGDDYLNAVDMGLVDTVFGGNEDGTDTAGHDVAFDDVLTYRLPENVGGGTESFYEENVFDCDTLYHTEWS